MTLTAKKIARLRQQPGRYIDGGDLGRGLYLQVTEGGASWLLRYERGGRERWLGLGSLADFSLKEARARAKQNRQLLADGIDPLEQKKADKAARALAAARPSFKEAAHAYFDQHERSGATPNTASNSCHPPRIRLKIGTHPVADIDTGAMLRVLEQKHKDYPVNRCGSDLTPAGSVAGLTVGLGGHAQLQATTRRAGPGISITLPARAAFRRWRTIRR
jgi:hypothetical protein